MLFIKRIIMIIKEEVEEDSKLKKQKNCDMTDDLAQ